MEILVGNNQRKLVDPGYKKNLRAATKLMERTRESDSQLRKFLWITVNSVSFKWLFKCPIMLLRAIEEQSEQDTGLT